MKNEYNNEYNNLTYDVIFIFFLLSYSTLLYSYIHYIHYANRFRFVFLYFDLFLFLDTDTVFVFSRDSA